MIHVMLQITDVVFRYSCNGKILLLLILCCQMSGGIKYWGLLVWFIVKLVSGGRREGRLFW
jgi:hypothetical protein